MKSLNMAFCVVCMTLAIVASGNDFDVIAMVGDKVITTYDVQLAMQSELMSLPENLSGNEREQMMEVLESSVIESMINYELAYLDFTAMGAKIPQDAIQRRINDIVVEKAGGQPDVFDDMLFRMNMTRKDFEAKLYKDVAVEAYIYDRVRRNIEIPEDEIVRVFNEQFSDVQLPSRYRIQVIALKKDGKFSSIGALYQAEKILEKLRFGEDFGKLARENSEAMNVDGGGDLGWQTEISPVLKDAIDGLQVGDVSAKPLDAGKYVYVVKLIGFESEAKATLTAELREYITRQLTKLEEKKRYDKLFAELENKYSVIRLYE